MTAYAQIVDGKIFGLFTSPQDPEYWPGVIELADDDPELLAYILESNIRGYLGEPPTPE